MTVQFRIDGGMLQVGQSFDFPAVYLDHWAVIHFSRNQTERERFLRALRSSGGALVVSHVNLCEVTGPSDPRHADEIAEFFEATLPNIYLATFDIQAAANQELRLYRPGYRLPAPADMDLLKLVGDERPDDFRAFTIARLVKVIGRNGKDLGATFRESNVAIANHVNNVMTDPETIEKAKTFNNHAAHLPTIAVLQELIRTAALDNTFRFVTNDASDLQHALVAMVYCDLALLDGKWEDLHDRMKRRFHKLGITVPTAEVWSARRNGVSKFLEKLESTIGPGRVESDFADARR